VVSFRENTKKLAEILEVCNRKTALEFIGQSPPQIIEQIPRDDCFPAALSSSCRK
jgi:hypothetical protein